MSTKVRIACRRCRTKRIKCDGGVPACSNCQKANEACIDVDGRNNALSIPRDFAANARSRIEWLEDQLRRVEPAIDLNDGPKVDFSFLDAASHVTTQGAARSPGSHDLNTALWAAPSAAEGTAAPPKRTHASLEEQTQEQPFATEARSVALDLGLLTLNSDSRQMHYLGTSSGRLFTSLIGLGSPETAARARSSRTPSIPSQPSPSGKVGPFAHTKRLKESCRLVYDSLRKALPSREDTQVLLEIYFRDIHVDHPFLHPGSLMDAIEAMYQCAEAVSAAEIGYNGWIEGIEPFSYNGEHELSRNTNCTPISIFTATFHVFMVFTLAATIRTRQRMYDFAPDQFYRIATSVTQYCFSKTSVATLQAILLLAVHSILTPTEMNIWTLTYTAMAHCVDMGLHRTSIADDGISKTASLIRRMVFYSVYHLDRSVATIQGRPLGIRDETFDVQLPAVEDIQVDASSIESRDFAPEIFIPGVLAFSLHRFKLDPIISEIKLLFYHLPTQLSAYAWPADHRSSQAEIRVRLEDWRRDLAVIVRSMPHDSDNDELDRRKYEMKLQTQFYAAMILLYQPSQSIPQPAEDALLICYQCAASRLKTCNDLYNSDSLFQSWRSVQGIFSAGATMIYCLWTSNLVQKSIPVTRAMSDLRTCTNLLSVGGEWWPSVKRGKETFGRAMDALLKKLDAAQHRGTGAYNGTMAAKSLRNSQQNPSQPPTDATDVHFSLPRVVNDVNNLISEMDHPFQDVSHDNQAPGDFAVADWTMLGSSENQGFQQLHDFDNAFFDMNLQSSDSTVEAFIAEFLQNDTAWNPF